GVARVNLAADDALELSDDGGADSDGVHGLVRRSAVAANALDGDLEGVSAGLERTTLDDELADGMVVGEVESKAGAHMGILHDAGLDHWLGAAGPLLGGLEDELDAAMQHVAVLHQNLGDGQQHGGVAVMAAGVVDAGVLGSVLSTRLLSERQGI